MCSCSYCKCIKCCVCKDCMCEEGGGQHNPDVRYDADMKCSWCAEFICSFCKETCSKCGDEFGKCCLHKQNDDYFCDDFDCTNK